MTAGDAALYEEPFRWAKEHVYPVRQSNRIEAHRLDWWRHFRPRPEMRRALNGLSHYITTPTVAKYRLFVWCDARICPDHQLIVIARDDDTTFGILHSRFHEVWSLRLGTSLEDRPRYTPTTTFETFPFPVGSDARTCLLPTMRERPARRQPSQMPPDGSSSCATGGSTRPNGSSGWTSRSQAIRKRPVPRDEDAAKALKTRTLTNLYNDRPQWLADAHTRRSTPPLRIRLRLARLTFPTTTPSANSWRSTVAAERPRAETISDD